MEKNSEYSGLSKIRTSLYRFLLCISNAQDLVSPVLSNHHQQVAYLAFRISEHIKLPVRRQNEIFLAALVHDIGTLSTDERLEIIETEPLHVNHHAFQGAKFLEGFKPLYNEAKLVQFHHLPWNHGAGRTYKGEKVSLGSHVIHLADRTCALIGSDNNVIASLPKVLSIIREKSGTIFEPSLVEALSELSKKEFIWLDLISQSPMEKIPDTVLYHHVDLEIDDMIDLSLLFSKIIDFRSSFTALHSAGVAKVAEKLAHLVGFSEYECKMMLIAGYLHDLGKLAISSDILDKPGKLSEDEFDIMRMHTYYTYRLLEPIESLRTINIWASYHHEKLNGNGYPFHIHGGSLSLGSRIMAVADVFTAITENRPYRKGMNSKEVKQVLEDMVADGSLDGRVVGLLLEHFQLLNRIRTDAQAQAARHYEYFMQMEA